MPIVSQLELLGSPTEQASYGATTYYWNPANDLAAGETISVPAAKVLQYDPAYPNDTKDVSSTALAAGSPFLGTGTYAGQVGLTVPVGGLTPGYEYRVQVSCLASGGHTPARFFRVRVQV